MCARVGRLETLRTSASTDANCRHPGVETCDPHKTWQGGWIQACVYEFVSSGVLGNIRVGKVNGCRFVHEDFLVVWVF